MGERGRVTATNGLRMRDSPRDGLTLQVIAPSEEVEVLGRETWLRVKYGGKTGFVLADYVEPLERTAAPGDDVVRIIEIAPSKVFKGPALRIDAQFEPSVRAIENLADRLGIALWITSSLREPYKPVTNAIVPPAKFSNHHVGHGFDMNVIFRNQWFRAEQLGRFASLPPELQTFLDEIRTGLGLRWGGDFVPADPVHIDDNLNHRDQGAFDRKLRALWGPPPK